MRRGKQSPEQWAIDYGLFARMTWPDRMTPGQRTVYEFCAAVRRGDPIPDHVLADLAQRLERVMQGDDAGAALGITKQRGGNRKRDPDEHWRRVHIAASVLAEKRRRPRATIARIADDLVEALGEKPSFIVDQYEQLKDEAAVYLKAHAGDFGALLSLSGLSGYEGVSVRPPARPRANR